jgi:hypothetical protein
MQVPEVFRYIAMGALNEELDAYPDLSSFFLDLVRDGISKSPEEVQELHRFVTDVLATNPSDEELRKIWFSDHVFVYFTPLGARMAFEAIRDACARIMQESESK